MPRATIVVGKRQKDEFAERGFLLLRGRAVTDCKRDLHRSLRALASRVLSRRPGPGWRRLAGRPFAEIFDGCVAREKDNALSRVFYELFPSCPEVIALAVHPLFRGLAHRLGVAFPIPSTLPIMRIDRPGEDRYLTPAHQDYWYSMLSPNSITFWMPVLPVTEEMGLLSVVPGSHKHGLLPTRRWSEQNPFTTARDFAESDFVPAPVDDDELLVFSQLLVHRSARNAGAKARLTLQVRYNDLETLEVPTSSFTPKYSPHVVAAQERAAADRARP